MTNAIKEFIENNITLIESEHWDEVFSVAAKTLYTTETRKLFEVLTEVFPELWHSITTIPPVYSDMQGTLEIPNNITKITSNAFEDSQLSKVIIPRSVTFIGRMAFSGCDNLTDVYIPSTVIKIQEFAFSSCPKLTIHYEEELLPSTWSRKWNSGHRPIKYGSTF